MTNEELTNWHNTIWWPTYKRFVLTPYKTQWKGGGRGESLSKVLKLKPSAALRETMIKALTEQTEHREALYARLGSLEGYKSYTKTQATGGEPVYKNRMVATYINNMGWFDEIPSLPSAKPEHEGRLCYCGKPVHGPRFDKCTEHAFEAPALKVVK